MLLTFSYHTFRYNKFVKENRRMCLIQTELFFVKSCSYEQYYLLDVTSEIHLLQCVHKQFNLSFDIERFFS